MGFAIAGTVYRCPVRGISWIVERVDRLWAWARTWPIVDGETVIPVPHDAFDKCEVVEP